MNITAPSTLRTRTTELSAPSARGAQAATFKAILSSLCEAVPGTQPILSPGVAQSPASQPTENITIHPGDCLSRICSERLTGQGFSASQREISAAVSRVAKANHLLDPNRIRAGQTLDVSMVGSLASSGTTPGPGMVPEGATHWQSLVEGAATLSSTFGTRKDPFTGQVKQHTGIDVAARSGAPIHACAAGCVIFSGWQPGYGNTVIIRHEDGRESLYGHASKLLVQVGEQVTCDTPIGCVGATGRATGAHLHFELRRNGQALNPLAC